MINCTKKKHRFQSQQGQNLEFLIILKDKLIMLTKFGYCAIILALNSKKQNILASLRVKR